MSGFYGFKFLTPGSNLPISVKLTSTSTPLWFLVENQRGVYSLRSSFQKEFQKSCTKVVFSGHNYILIRNKEMKTQSVIGIK